MNFFTMNITSLYREMLQNLSFLNNDLDDCNTIRLNAQGPNDDIFHVTALLIVIIVCIKKYNKLKVSIIIGQYPLLGLGLGLRILRYNCFR